MTNINRMADIETKLAALRETDAYKVEVAIADFTTDVDELMEGQGLTKRELAERLGVTPANVSKILRGDNNFTIRTMARVAGALGRYVRVHLAPDGVAVRWRELTPEEARAEVEVAEVRLGPELGMRLERLVERTGASKAECVREAVGRFLDQIEDRDNVLERLRKKARLYGHDETEELEAVLEEDAAVLPEDAES